ncbi:M20 family metallopeptidase [Deinococcus sp. PESE-13]
MSAVLGDGLREQVVAWRRHLHQHPELGFQEHQTARYVEEQLRDMPGLHLSRPTETSVLAVLKGGKPGRTVLLRADMDALPIEEEADVEFKSQTPGVMHACGHDGHTAMLLGAAKQLSAQAADLHGEVRFIFQHAEEVFPGGAGQLVDAGVMDGVDLAVGTHLMTSVPVGTVVLRDGALMAAPDAFDITIQGRGGHGAMPHQTVDPVVIAAQVVMAFQTAVSRLRDPIDPGVVSVTQIHGGSAHNVIPDTVTLGGTVRTFSDELRAQMPERLETLLRGICEAYGATYTFTYHGGYRSVNNDPATTERLREVVREVLPDVTVSDGVPLMGGEDFSAYLTRAPGTFVLIGAGNVEKGMTAPHHHPKFMIDESALEQGVQIYVGAARTLTAS